MIVLSEYLNTLQMDFISVEANTEQCVYCAI